MDESSAGSVFVGIIFVLIAALLYFLPTIIAVKRDHPSYLAIFVVNLFLGWMLIGWIIALVWSLSGTYRPTVVTQKVVKKESSLTEKLEELNALKEKGILTEEEYSVKKAKILEVN